MRILALGDVTDPRAVAYLKDKLWQFRRDNKIDFTVVNAENSNFVFGANAEQANDLLSAGADVLTGGNHTMQNKLIFPTLENDDRVIRPVNFPSAAPGAGYTILDCNGYKILVLNALGKIHIEPVLDPPIESIEKILRREDGNYDFSILDFHAETTGEKGIVGRYFDGRINIIFGTHTHVQTADARIFPNGTAFISDVGMCGITDSILGIDPACVIEKYLTGMPVRYMPASGDIEAQGVIFTLDEASSRVTKIEPVRF